MRQITLNVKRAKQHTANNKTREEASANIQEEAKKKKTKQRNDSNLNNNLL